MKIAMACLIGLVLSVGTVWAEPVVEGRVRLSSGGPAAGAQVLVFDLADMSRWVGATTDASGHFVLSLGALASGQALPEGFGLGQNYPNPFNPGTVIPYQLAADGYVRLEVFNLLGQRVVTLVEGEMSAGRYTAAWDGRDASGQGVAAGVYVYRLTAGGGVATRRMTLVDGAASTGSGGGVGSMVGMQGADEGVYGLTVSGVGVETYVDAGFVVGSGPVDLVVAAAAATGSGKAAAEGVLGDVSNDGRVNISDALIVATYSVNSAIVVPNNGDIQLGDVNGDGWVNVSDALIIATYSIDPTNPALPAGIGQPVGDNQPPIAHAGPDQSVDRRETIALDGSNSSDPEGRPLSFAWRQVAGDPVELSNAEVAEPTFNTQVTGLYAFELVVHDGRSASAPDTVGIEIVAISDAAVKVGSPDAALVYKETTGNQMTFAVQGTAPPVEVGDVMVNTVEPYFLKKVVSVQSQNATEVVVITEDAAVTDVIEEARIRRTFRFPAAKVVGSELSIGNYSFGAWADADLSITRADLSFTREVEMDWEIWKSSSRFFKMHLTGEIVALLEMKFESAGGFSIAEERTLPKKYSYSYTQKLIVGGIPMWIKYSVEFGMGVDITVESASSITKGVRITKPVEMGVKYENGSWENLTGGGAATYEPLGPIIETEGALDIRGYLFGEVSAKLYSLAGPFFGVTPYVGLGAAEFMREVRNQIEQDQIEWSLHTGVDGYVGVGAGFLKKIGIDDVSAEWDFNIFHYSLIDGIIPLVPDVLVDQLTVSPAAIVADTPATVQVRVANRGLGRASPALVVLRVNGQVVDSAEVKLKAGEDTEVKFEAQVLGAGSHAIEVEVDPEGNLATETVRGNNRVSRTVTATGPASAVPDMVVDRLTLLPADIETYTPVTVRVRVANEGTGRVRQALVVLRVNGQVVDSRTLDFDANTEKEVEFDPRVLGLGSHSIEVEVDPDGNLTSETVRGNNRVSRTVQVEAQLASARSVVFILDLSGSMDDAAGDGRTRLEAAKAALADVLSRVPTDGSQEYALTTFSGCGGVKVPIGFTVDPQAVVSYSSGLVADGGTPLAAALRRGQHLGLDDASNDAVLLVLLSDGEETCDGDPVGVARLIGQRIRAKAVASLDTLAKVIKVNTIGFGVEPGSAADQQIRAIAEEAGGKYFQANETADLAEALGEALEEPREERSFSLPGGGEMAFVWIEPGVFQMGSPSGEWGRDSDEGPVHEVEISTGFWLGKYEVTQGEWESVMGTTPWSGEDYVRSNPSHPAVWISWNDVQRFVDKLNASAGEAVYRLPTETEWEYACRAGTSTRWSFGDDESELTHYAWYDDNAWDVGERYAHAVGTKRANRWGLYDMHGNVWEWVQDWYSGSYYNSSPRVDPLGPTSGSDRVIRGGGFSGDARGLRSAGRARAAPDGPRGWRGVRLLRIR